MGFLYLIPHVLLKSNEDRKGHGGSQGRSFSLCSICPLELGRQPSMLMKFDLTGTRKQGSNAVRDSVWVMSRCTHPRFQRCEIANIHAAQSDTTCVLPASNAAMSDVGVRAKMGSEVGGRGGGA